MSKDLKSDPKVAFLLFIDCVTRAVLEVNCGNDNNYCEREGKENCQEADWKFDVRPISVVDTDDNICGNHADKRNKQTRKRHNPIKYVFTAVHFEKTFSLAFHNVTVKAHVQLVVTFAYSHFWFFGNNWFLSCCFLCGHFFIPPNDINNFCMVKNFCQLKKK